MPIAVPDEPIAVIFDIDGTLIDSVDFHAESWQRVLREFGHEFPFQQVRSQIGKGGDQLIPALLGRREAERLGKELEERRKRIFVAEYLPRVRPFPGVRALFERLIEAGLSVGLASSAKGDELAEYKRIAMIDDLVPDGAATSSDDADRSKPHPDIFHASLAKLGVPARRAIAVGDTPYDAEAAGKAGIATVGVLCGGFPETDLRRAGCAEVYRDPAEILTRFDETPLGRSAAVARR